MSRTIVITDPHAMLRLFDKLLYKVGYEPKKDKLILLGDYVDRGPNSKELIDRIIEIKKLGNVITLKGNHDDWFDMFLNGKMDYYDIVNWFEYGGFQTLQSYLNNDDMKSLNINEMAGKIKEENPDHVEFLKNLDLYHEDDHFYYVHAGVNPNYLDIKNNNESDFYWMKRNIFFSCEHSLEKPLVFGHTPVYSICRYSNEKILEDLYLQPYISKSKKKIGIDGGAVYGNRLYAMCIVDGEYSFEYVDIDD